MKLILNPNAKLSRNFKKLKITGPNVTPLVFRDNAKLIRFMKDRAEERESLRSFFESEKDYNEILNFLIDSNILIPEHELFTRVVPKDIRLTSDKLFKDTFRYVRGYTMSTPELLFSIYNAMKYMVDNNLAGDLVFSGVWRGGVPAFCGLVLKTLGDISRNFFLYDLFDNTWPEPSSHDQTIYGRDYSSTKKFVSDRENEKK